MTATRQVPDKKQTRLVEVVCRVTMLPVHADNLVGYFVVSGARHINDLIPGVPDIIPESEPSGFFYSVYWSPWLSFD